MSSRQSISFDSIVKGRDASVRVSDDNLLYAVDLVMVMSGKNCNDSNECLRDLNASLFNKECILMHLCSICSLICVQNPQVSFPHNFAVLYRVYKPAHVAS